MTEKQKIEDIVPNTSSNARSFPLSKSADFEKIEKLIPDTSVIIEGLVSKKINEKELKVDFVIIHEAVIAELEHQANL